MNQVMKYEVEIIDYEPDLAVHFTNLNLAWVQKYVYVEPMDRVVLGNPQEFIIDKGGYIFFARLHNEIVGTFALIRKDNNVFELSKMAVSENHQGKKIGNRMLEYCLLKAKELKISQVVLFSNTILEPAIHLYRKYGFKEVPIGNSEYKRSNVKMEIDIN